MFLENMKRKSPLGRAYWRAWAISKYSIAFVFLVTDLMVHPATLSAQWAQTNGPGSGLGAIASSGKYIYVTNGNHLNGNLGTPIFRSSNNGAYWFEADSGLSGDITSLVASGNNV